MHVGINLYGMVHDLYYPYVGYENHSRSNNMRHRIGVWSEGKFSWLDDGTWQFNMNYEPHALIGHFTAHNDELEVTLEFSDCVDSEYDAFLRNIHIVNAAERPREIRLFMHQVLLINNSLNADTVQYLPDELAILQYKSNRAFVIGAIDQKGLPFEQYSMGVFGIEGKDGVYRDAEDGSLSGNVVEHGKVDSIIGFTPYLEALSSTRISYWLVAAKSQEAAIELHQKIKAKGLHDRFERTAAYWRRWLEPAEKVIQTLPRELRSAVRKNVLIIKSQIDHKGAVIASTDTTMLNYSRDAYVYCWPRDASYALWPLLRMGYKTELKNYFAFCRDVLHPQGFLMHKYQPDGGVGASWHPYTVEGRIVPPIQEDETAIVIFLLSQYVQQTKDKQTLEEFYETLVVPAANFMADYIDEATNLPHATYDLWEEKFLTTTYTTALVYAALCAAAKMAEQLKHHKDAVRWQMVADDMQVAAHQLLFNPEKNYFYKGFTNHGHNGLRYDDTVDLSSFYGAFMFGLFDVKSQEMKHAHATLDELFHLSHHAVSPVPRYENDQYNTVDPSGLGNPWFITTFWMAQYALLEEGDTHQAQAAVDWALELMMPTGVLSEQINPYSYKFISVAPLAWSQAEFLNTVLDLTEKKTEKGESVDKPLS